MLTRYCTNQFRASLFIRMNFSLCNPHLLMPFKNQNKVFINTNSCKLFIHRHSLIIRIYNHMSISNLHHVSFHLEIEQFYTFYINGKYCLFVLFWSQLKFLCMQNERNLGYPYTKVHEMRPIRSETLVIFFFFANH